MNATNITTPTKIVPATAFQPPAAPPPPTDRLSESAEGNGEIACVVARNSGHVIAGRLASTPSSWSTRAL